MAWLHLTRALGLLDRSRPFRLLHFAPEPALRRQLSVAPHIDYFPVDYKQRDGIKLRLDATSLPFPGQTFDAIYCSHVLEHVVDDMSALREFKRALRPGGWALIQVPIRGLVTHEDPTITTATGRELAFGQWDHVRSYGLDVVGRMEGVGFHVSVVGPADISLMARFRYGLAEDILHVCSAAPSSD